MYLIYLIIVNLIWQVKHGIFHFAWMLGWMPHFLYIKSLTKKIHRVYLLRGGKYCRVVMMDLFGVRYIIKLELS